MRANDFPAVRGHGRLREVMGNVLEDPARSPAATCASRRADARHAVAARRRGHRRVRLAGRHAGVAAARHALSALDEKSEEALIEQDRAFVAGRTAGDDPLDVQHAGQLRAKAAHAAKQVGKTAPASGPTTFAGAWSSAGPRPTGQYQRSDGRGTWRAAASVRSRSGRAPAGSSSAAPRAGIWTNDGTTWTARTDDQETQAVGALAVAPSKDAVVYAGTGEGALSGDSYFGDGILKSTDGGTTWSHVSGDYFEGVSVSRLVVDPTNARPRLRRGPSRSRRLAPRDADRHSRYGIWESKDGGASWTLLARGRRGARRHGPRDRPAEPEGSVRVVPGRTRSTRAPTAARPGRRS